MCLLFRCVFGVQGRERSLLMKISRRWWALRKSELELDGKEEKEEGRPYFGGGGGDAWGTEHQ